MCQWGMCHIQSKTNDLMTAYKFLDESRALFNTTVKHDKFASLWNSLKCFQRSEAYGNVLWMEAAELCFRVDISLNKIQLPLRNDQNSCRSQECAVPSWTFFFLTRVGSASSRSFRKRTLLKITSRSQLLTESYQWCLTNHLLKP